MNTRRVRTLIPIVVLVAFAISAPVHATFNSEGPSNPESLLRNPRSVTYADSTTESKSIQPASATELALAMGIPPTTLVSASLGTSDPRGAGTGDASLSYFPRLGDRFAILSTGLAASADSPNDENNLTTELDGLDNSLGWDLVQLTLDLQVPANKSCMGFDFAFYSEEFPNFVGLEYNDTFTAELGGTNISLVEDSASNRFYVVAPLNIAYDSLGSLISVNTVAGVTGNTGTTYNGATPLLTAKAPVPAGKTIQVVLSIQDLGDSGYDSAVFLDNFRWLDSESCRTGSQMKPPLILVHGFQGLENSDLTCDPHSFNPDLDIVRYSQVRDNPTTAAKYWGPLAAWFEDNGLYGYDVWIAQLRTGAVQGTPSLWENASCLIDQINYVHGQNDQPITLVGHDMGGVVTRAALTDPVVQGEVKSLYTVEAANAGLSVSTINALLGTNCGSSGSAYTGLCNLESKAMVAFNDLSANSRQVGYTFIGGVGNPNPNIYFGLGPHDGLVGGYSAAGWLESGKFLPSSWPLESPPTQIWTDEVHSGSFTGNTPMSFRDDGIGYSQTYLCILSLDNDLPLPNFCTASQYPANSLLNANVAAETLDQLTRVLDGSIHTNEIVTEELNLDTDQASQFYLSWDSGTLALALIDPNGQLIDPSYAELHPDRVSYHYLPGGPDISPLATYYFTNTIQGAWQLKVTAGDVGTSGANYEAYAALQSNRTLTFHTNKDLYRVGETAVLTATLQDGQKGIPGASLSVNLTPSNATSQTINLQDQGNGNYTASYTIPDSPGPLAARATAEGVDNGVLFSRHVDWLGSIVPNLLEFTGIYAGQPRNENGDALYEVYDLAVEVSATQQTQVTFVANLSAQGTVVAKAHQEAELLPGKQTIHLNFSGDDIRRSGLNGPYTVSQLAAIDELLGIPVAIVQNLMLPGAYNWQEFGGCHALTISVLPDLAGHIQANPAPNCSDSKSYALYSTGTQVELTAQPGYGYWFANWIVDVTGSQNPVQLVVDRSLHVTGNFFKITWGEPDKLLVWADPDRLSADGASSSLVRALVKDAAGNLTPGVEVTFSTDMGQLNPITATTGAAGIAETRLTAPTESGSAVVKATAGAVNGSTLIHFGKFCFLPLVQNR